ncbi:23295_t:CDS:1, partial [Dentiscutata erythropus]
MLDNFVEECNQIDQLDNQLNDQSDDQLDEQSDEQSDNQSDDFDSNKSVSNKEFQLKSEKAKDDLQ